MMRADIRHLDCHTRKRLIVMLAQGGIPARDIATTLEMNLHGIRSVLWRMGLTKLDQPRFNYLFGRRLLWCGR